MSFKSSIIAAIVASPLFVVSQSSAIPVDLGTAADFAILAKSGISTTGTSSVVGDIGVSPAAASSITGFGLVADASNTFSTSSLVVGRALAADYTPPTPANLTTAVGDMETAYTDAAGRPADVTELGAGNIGGMTLAPGVYKWGTGLTIPTDVTLSGGSNDVWIFQVAGTLTVSSDTSVILGGAARASNIFWQVAGQTTLGTDSRFKGIILDQTAIVMNAGATLDGRALAQTAVTLISNAVTEPASSQFDEYYHMQSLSDPSNNTCAVGVSGLVFRAFGDVRGVGTAGQAVRISYDTPSPTKASRSPSGKWISVKQSNSSTLEAFFDGVSATGGPVSVEKCSVSGRANTRALVGWVSVKCRKAQSLFSLLTASEIASIETAFDGNAKVKVKVNSDGSKAKLSIRCGGDAFSD